MATPVLAELRAAMADYQRRMLTCTERMLEVRQGRLAAAARGLPRPADVLALAAQRFDLAAGRLGAALEKNTSAHERELVRTLARFTPALLERPAGLKQQRLTEVAARFAGAARRGPERIARHARLPALGERLGLAVERRLTRASERLAQLDKLRLSLDPNRPLALGFALVHRADGAIARSGAALAPGEAVTLRFADSRRGAVIDGTPQARADAPRPAPKAKPAAARSPAQGDLF